VLSISAQGTQHGGVVDFDKLGIVSAIYLIQKANKFDCDNVGVMEYLKGSMLENSTGKLAGRAMIYHCSGGTSLMSS